METVSANAPTIHERKASTGDNDRWSTRIGGDRGYVVVGWALGGNLVGGHFLGFSVIGSSLVPSVASPCRRLGTLPVCVVMLPRRTRPDQPGRRTVPKATWQNPISA